MKSLKHFLPTLLLIVLTLLGCQNREPVPVVDTQPDDQEQPETPPGNNPPSTSIPVEFVGTWYADHNQGSLVANWEEGTFQGEPGFREFRTMVFTRNGKDAVEYTSEVYTSGDEVKQYLYKITGTLAYQPRPATLTFHAQSGQMRIFSNKYPGYKESAIAGKDLKTYQSVLFDPQATTFQASTNYLTARRKDGDNHFSVKYIKADGTVPPGNDQPNPSGPYATPPASGTYVKIAGQYYPTVTIAGQEWTSVNYAGAGGITDNDKPQFGTFLKRLTSAASPCPRAGAFQPKGTTLGCSHHRASPLTKPGKPRTGTTCRAKSYWGNSCPRPGGSKLMGTQTTNPASMPCRPTSG
jgi:uncharacterized lipoprotein NlpE involved in copper resistance